MDMKFEFRVTWIWNFTLLPIRFVPELFFESKYSYIQTMNNTTIYNFNSNVEYPLDAKYNFVLSIFVLFCFLVVIIVLFVCF